jgi:hypothetical protein
MWISLWGLILPISIIGLFFLAKEKRLAKAWIAGLIAVFIMANIILTQPIYWDNAKLFMWSYLGFSVLCAMVLVRLLNLKVIGIMIATVLFLSLTTTGVLELTRLQQVDRNIMQITAADDINLGIKIRNSTNPLSVFMTDTATNHFVMVWGARSIVMGFTPWVENFGFPSSKRFQDMQTMFSGDKPSLSLLKQYSISYVVIGPGEKYSFKVNEAYYAKNFRVAFKNNAYIIYDVRFLTDAP